MVIHVDLAIKVEVLPVVYKSGTYDEQAEPFVLYRPEHRQWEDGYARAHQRLLSLKNSILSGSNFKPMIKVLKHLRSHWASAAVVSRRSGHYIASALTVIARTSADDWYRQVVSTLHKRLYISARWPECK
jgi:hypothetical protein